MTSRERVQKALNHEETDKIPVDCGGMRSTGLLGVAYNRLKEHVGIKGGKTKIYDIVQQLAIPEEWYLEKFCIDVMDLARTFADNEEEWREWQLPDGSRAFIPAWLRIERKGDSWVCINKDNDIVAKMPADSLYFDQLIWPLYGVHKENFDDLPQSIEKIMWSHMTDPLWKNAERPDFYQLVREKARKLYEETDYAIMTGFGGQLFELGQFLYRNDEFMMNLLAHRKEMEKMFDKLLEIHLEKLEPFLDAVSPYVQIIVMGDDLGTQNGPMISPKLYREVFYPRHREIYQMVKQKTDIAVFMHSCGGIYEFLPDLIEAGVDIINPVQTQSAGMDPIRLKKEFGKDLVFWGGGIDTQHNLPNLTAQKVKDEVKRNVEIFMPGGGYVFNQIHNILADVPPENIIAMYEAVHEM